ncbi:FtsX-like permease family protein [Streptacidiphilus sp. EB129]|uniref:FtsX-like permease family protein n=1 Tax=Streptacidiphilus sp. EB129 TaxID=3156262 RepID=UPI003518BD26
MGRFVLLRLRAHRLLIAAALLTVLLTTSVLAALAGFTSAVGDAGIRRTLATTDAAGTPLLLQRHLTYQDRAAAGRDLAGIAAAAFPGLPTSTAVLHLSDPYSLPGSRSADDPDTTTLGTPDRARLRLLSGSWPGVAVPAGTSSSGTAPAGAALSGTTPAGALPAAPPVPVAVPVAASRRLGPVGTVLSLKNRISGLTVRILVTGVYTVRDGGDRYWQLDPLAGKGSLRTSGSTSSGYGPLLVDDSAFRTGAVAEYQAFWQIDADFGGLRGPQLQSLAAANLATATRVGTPAGNGLSATYGAVTVLPQLLDQLQHAVLVARATLLVAVLQLVLLALMTLLLTARLLAEERESDNALLRARGAAPRRVAALAAAEALLLVLPALLLAPLLAGPLIRLLGDYGPLSAAQVRLDVPQPLDVGWAALAAALCSALVMLGPTLARARSWSEQRRGRTRRAALPGLLRGGADLALVGLALAAYWQLDHYASQSGGTGMLTPDSDGTLGVDPVLVAAPTLALCAGTVLTLRLLPLAARLAERLTVRGRGLPAALVGWQFARRPHQATGPILVLSLAAAVGTLSLAQGATWTRSQSDQAAFDTGGDVRVASNTAPAFGQGGQYTALPGVTAAVPVGRQAVPGTDGRTGELIALDATTEGGRYPLRPDLSDRSAAQLMALLPDAPVPAARQGLPIPGRPAVLTLDVRAALAGGSPATMTESSEAMLVTVVDRYGIRYTLDSVDVPLDGQSRPVRFDLAAAAGAGTPAYPLTLASLTLTTPVSAQGPVRQTFTVQAVHGDSVAAAPPGLHWDAAFDPGISNAMAFDPTLYTPGGAATASTTAQAPLVLTFATGSYRGSTAGYTPTGTVTVTPAGATDSGTPLPAVADQRFLDSTGAHLGSVLPLPSGQGAINVRIAAVVTALPGTGPDAEQGLSGSALIVDSGVAEPNPAAYGGALLVDLPSYNRRAAANGIPMTPSEWWLSTGSAPGAAGRVGAEARALPGVQAVFVRDEVAGARQNDPLGTGPEAALLAAVALAVALAAVGFTADAAGAVRRRAGETAVLRALGAPRRVLARATTVELGLPVLLGVGVGLLLGETVTRMVVPLLVLTPQARRPVPDVRVLIPDGRLLLLLLAIAAVPLLVAALAGLRGGDPAQRLRQPEES